MSSSSTKENSRKVLSSAAHTLGSTGRLPQMASNPDPASVISSPAASDRMLSPPPEEELRLMRRPTNEPSSTSRPLANRSNRQSTSEARQSTPISKRKRTVTQNLHSPNLTFTLGDTSSMMQTPNPRSRKQVRQAPDSPSPAPFLNSMDSNHARDTRSPTPRTPRQDDLLCSPTRKGKSRGTPRLLVPKSPHRDNPDANYIPPTQLSVDENNAVSYRRRSITPIPPYEPPPERFTPPREIVVSPIVANDKKPSTARVAPKKKRNSGGKTEKAPNHMRIKTEPPEIDLSPAPPASPGEDPILLIGPPQPNKSKHPRKVDSSRIIDVEMDLELPEHERRTPFANLEPVAGPSRGHTSSSIPPAFDFSNLNDDTGDMNMTWTDDTSSDALFDNPVQDNINAGRTVDNWSDSDSEDENKKESVSMGEGDFTGKFVAYFSPIRRDPPTSATRERMEEWGRPISPHPRALSFTEPKEEDDSDTIMNQAIANGELEKKTQEGSSDDDDETPNATPSRSAYADKRGRRLTLTELEKIKFGSLEKDRPRENESEQDGMVSFEGGAPEDEPDYSHSNIENEAPANMSLDSMNSPSNIFKSSLKISATALRPSNSNAPLKRLPVEGHRSEEESSQGTLVNNESICLENSTSTKKHSGLKHRTNSLPASRSHEFLVRKPEEPVESDASAAETELEETDEAGNESDDSGADLSVVKIMSEDPMAAARAAAILKMHDYDMVARKLRRRTTASGGIGKAYKAPSASQLWRRRTVAGLSAEAELAANISLPELLDKAETELRDSPSKSRSASLALSASSQKNSFANVLYPNAEADGIRDWTKADWKLLDSCFTDERYEVGEEQGIGGERASVDDIQLENVVDRFVDLMGGLDKVLGHGPSWSIEKLLNRTKVLCKRQRSGEGAPPTPDVSSRFASPSRFRTLSPSSSMIMPEFTPQGPGRIRNFDAGTVSRKISLPAPSTEPFFKVPAVPFRLSTLRQSTTPPIDATPKASRAKALFGFSTPVREDEDSDDESVAMEVETLLTPVRAERMKLAQQNPRPPSAVKRSLGFISSWLKPDTYKAKVEKKDTQRQPGLPVPPSDVLARPRGPVETPDPKPLERAIPHKELVDLDHIDLPPEVKDQEKPEPKRLVELYHVPTPAPKENKRMSRRSSSSSVKDLVREFEAKERAKALALPPRVKELRKQGGLEPKKVKPGWRP